MHDTNAPAVKKVMKSYRRRIDALDRKLAALLGERFGIMREVAKVKIENGFHGFIAERVNEVRDNAIRLGKKHGVDPQFMRTLYTLLIYESCATEDVLMHKMAKKKNKK